MKTREDLWDWVWREGWEEPPEGVEPGEDDFVEVVASDDDEGFPALEEALDPAPDRLPAPVLAPRRPVVRRAAEPSVPTMDEPRPDEPEDVESEPVDAEPPLESVPLPTVVRPERTRRNDRRRLRRRMWRAAVAALVGAAGALAVLGPEAVRGPGRGTAPPQPPPIPQTVSVWTVWDERPTGSAFVAVLATGGARDPLALAIPGNATVSIPGHGLGTVDDAAATRDVTTVAATVENILGVRVDEAWGIPLEELRGIVNEVGPVTGEGEPLDGRELGSYLGKPGEGAALERSIRWQSVLTGLVDAISADEAEMLDAPDGVRELLASDGVEVLALPVEDIGTGLARPDEAAVAELVAERFVPTAGGEEEKIRLVVLNGNGTPGIGQHVARILVPEGYRLVASQNASEFGVKVTKIIASDREDLPAARKARHALGVGRVFIGNQASGVADVTVVVGLDFGGR